MEGEGPPPFEWVVSRVCEEFKCLPSQAVEELMNDPSHLALDIMEIRSYARAKEILDNAKKAEEVPKSKAIDRVWEITYELIERRKGGA